jgi:DnaJ family protein A protein 5
VAGVHLSNTRHRLKKAYRKKALELHPDRNHGDTERTTALFAEIQTAYEVLSDEQERAWYDSHEGDILRGGSGEGATEDHYQGNMRMTTSNDLTRMMGKFRSNVDFSDSPNGFFGYVRDTFQQLAKEEYAADYEDINIPDYPTFGHKDDTHDDVVREFYSAWNGFATVKSFAWMDQYRLSDAPDRRTRRLMEKENQKFRDDGRRELNEAVRTLVAFVRKRDPRYTPNTQSADEKAKAQRDARRAQAARARAAQMAKLEEEAQALPSWATARHESDEEDETEEEIEEDIFECVACNKTFKSEAQWDAHERSKKHQKAIQSLKRKMQKDNAHLDLDKDAINSDVITAADDDLEVDISASETNGLDDSVQDLTEKTGELKVEDDGTGESEDEGNVAAEPRTTHDVEPDSDDDDDDEYASRSDIEARLNGLASTNASTRTDTPTTTDTLLDESVPKPDDAAPGVPKLGKAAQKRAKRAAKQAEIVDTEAPNKCTGCDATFPSKTQLHQHLQNHPKHAALKSVPGGKGKKKGKR